jgi:hypothetical protein
MEALKEGTWLNDPEFKPPKDTEQVSDYFKLLSKITYLARFGEPDTSTSVNVLGNGIWEFKHGARRVTYWDTPGDGTFSPKQRVAGVADWDGEEYGSFWWYPAMDEVLRLGCGWPKTGPKAPSNLIAEAESIRVEDLKHDGE